MAQLTQRPHVLECAKKGRRADQLPLQQITNFAYGPKQLHPSLDAAQWFRKLLDNKDPLIKLQWCTMDSSEMLEMNSKKDPEGNLTLHSNTLCSFGRWGFSVHPFVILFDLCV